MQHSTYPPQPQPGIPREGSAPALRKINMSLDVYLCMTGTQTAPTTPQTFIREDGQTRAISRKEWDRRFPGREPVTVTLDNTDCVYTANITHNLGGMAQQAGLYDVLWRPDEQGMTHACDLIAPLASGVDYLVQHPEECQALNPSNGWGTYEGLVAFVRHYLAACRDYPEAEVRVSR